MHRYRNPNEEDGAVTPDDTHEDYEEEAVAESTPVFQRFDRAIEGGHKKQEIFSIPFIKKYILYAKHRVAPVLTDEACQFINLAYSTLRSKDDMKTLPVTTRTLETMIRLTTAHAKCRLSDEATEVTSFRPVKRTIKADARVALEILNYALYHDNSTIDIDNLTGTTQPTQDKESSMDVADQQPTPERYGLCFPSVSLKIRSVQTSNELVFLSSTNRVL